MPVEQVLGRWATGAAALALLAILGVARSLSASAAFKRDLRGSQLYLLGFLCTEALRRLTPDRWVALEKTLYVAGLVLFAFGAIRGAASAAFQARRAQSGVEVPKILRDIVDGALFVVALLVILQATLEFDLSALLASSAVVSLVLGLALQETLGNLFAGLSLQAERPFAEGDWVRIGPHTGRVLEIGWRATRVVTGAGEVLTVPNNAVAKEAIYNLSRRGSVLRRVTLGVGYDVAPNAVKDLVLELVRAHPRIVAEPAPAVRTVDFGASAIGYDVQFWVARHEEGAVVEDEIRTQLWYRLRRAGIDIPFPTSHVQLSRAAGTGPRTGEAAEVDVAGLLAHVDFLAPVAPALRSELARRARVVRFGRGETVLRQGDTSEGPFFVVADGEVAVRVRALDGHEEELARLGPGEFFGEMAVLTGAPRTATVVAARDSTLVAVDREGFAELFHQAPEAAESLAHVLARRREGLVRAMQSSGREVPSPQPEPHQLLERLREVFKHLG